MIEWQTLPDSTRAMFWVIGAIEALDRLGLVRASMDCEIGPSGVAVWDQMDAQWRPENKAIAEALAGLFPDMDNVADVHPVLLEYRDNRARLVEISEGCANDDY